MKKSIFAFCLILGLAFGAQSAFSVTHTKVYAQSVSGADVAAAGNDDRTYTWVGIECSSTLCSLKCQGAGFLACKWENAAWCVNCEGDLFEAADGQEMFDHALDQIDASVASGTYINNILPPGSTHYFRSITWSYNSSASEYTMTLTLTEVTP